MYSPEIQLDNRQQIVNSSNQKQSMANEDNKIPPSLLNRIAVESVNNKKGITFGG